MTKTFLVATDLSPRADRAVQRAFRLAEWLGAKLFLVSIVDEDLPPPVATTLQDATELQLARFAASIQGSGKVAHDTRVVSGDPALAIPALAVELDVDLVILGEHRRRAFLDLVRETTMERIVRHCDRPVLLVHDTVDHTYATVLCALDFAPASTAALCLAAELAPEADLHGVHAIHIPYHGFVAPRDSASTDAPFRHNAELNLKNWSETCALPERLSEVQIIEGAAHMVLAREIARLKPDLLALGAHGRAGQAPSILGSLANDFVREPPCDLLIARS